MKKLIIALLIAGILIPASVTAHEYLCEGCSIPVKDMGTFTATAYCDCESCCGKTDGKTATGTTCHDGTIAVDANLIPLGSTVYIEFEDGSIKECIAEDTGGAIKRKKIDVYFESHSEALEFGRKEVRVYVVKE